MNNTDPPATEQVNKPPERLHDTAGMMLRKGRENANLTHAAVGEALHLTVHYIKALENDDHNKLPGATFVKGYIRTYARFLKLDVNAVLASYERNSVSAEELNSRTESLSRVQKRHDQTFRWAVITAVIIVAGVAAGWWFVGKNQVRAGAVTAIQQQPAEPQVGRTTAGAAASTAASQVSTVQASTMSASYAPTSTVAGAESFPSGHVAVAAGLAATQAMPLATTRFQAVASTLPSTGTTLVIDTTVTDSSISAEAGAAVDNQATAAVQNASVITAIPEQSDVALTVTPSADGSRQVTLMSEGADIIQLYFKGSSWVEIDDGVRGRLYNETLNMGDEMTLHGTAPFQILLGDASQVELTYNSEPINLASQIRGDKTARFSLGTVNNPSAATTAAQGANP